MSNNSQLPNKPPASSTKRWGTAILVLLALVVAGFLLRYLLSQKEGAVVAVPHPTVQKGEETVDAKSEIKGRYYGLCKKNSIRSVEDFRKIVRNDPVLAAHFARFDWDSARLGNQEHAVWTYVSYRKGEEIRRTSRPVKLPKGDGYVTDGTQVVRTFCCNDYEIASAPPAPEAPVERVDAPARRPGTTESVDGPTPLASWPPDYDAERVVPETLPRDLIVPFTGPKYSHHEPFHVYSTPKKHDVVPEPGTFVLFGTGAGVLALFALRRRR